MLKPIFIFVTATLLASACVSCIPQSEFESATNRISELEVDIDSMEREKDELLSSITEMENELLSSTASNEVLIADYEELKAAFLEANASNISMSRELSDYVCEETLSDMEYDVIIDISARLQAWVTNQSWASRATYTVRDTIWDNTDTKLHGVSYISSDDNEHYLTWFLVYFDEFGWDEGVFWLDGQCWLEKR